jgi:heme exporter protein D
MTIGLDLGPYTSFIATSYLAAALVVVVLIGWIAVDYRQQKARLRVLEQSGIVRRSGRPASDIR